MTTSGDGSHRTAAVNAAMKACEHFAGQVTALVPQVTATSPALERVKSASEALTACFHLLEVNSKNVALVEGIVCQIIEPDMQQTASYLERVVGKDLRKAQSSLQRHNTTLNRAADRLWSCTRELSGTADGSTKLPRSSSKKSSRKDTLPATSLPATSTDTTVQTGQSDELLHPREGAAQSGAYHPGAFMYPYNFQMPPMIATQRVPNSVASPNGSHNVRALPHTHSPLASGHHNSPFAHGRSSPSPFHSQGSAGLAPVYTNQPASPSTSDFSKGTPMHGGLVYPCTPSTVSAQDGSCAGGSHSAPLLPLPAGCSSDSQTVRAFFMGRVLQRRLLGNGRLGPSAVGAGAVQLDATEKKAARKMAKKEARAIVRLRKDNDAFSEVFSNPSISSNDASVFGRLGLMADHSAPGMRQVLMTHDSRSWSVWNASKLAGELSDVSTELSGRVVNPVDVDLDAELTAAEAAQQNLSQELDQHEVAGTGVAETSGSLHSNVPVVERKSLDEQWQLTIAKAASAQEELSHELEIHDTNAQHQMQGSTNTQLAEAVGDPLRTDSVDSTAAVGPRASVPQDSAAEQEALSAEIEQQEAAAQRLTQALAAERSFPGNAPSPVQGLERVPTAAVMGQQWADEVHAARAAQEDIDRRIAPEAGDAVARSSSGTGLQRVPTEAVVGKVWAADVYAAAVAQDELSRTLGGVESVGSCSMPDPSDVPSAPEAVPTAPSRLHPAAVLGDAQQSTESVDGLERVPTEAVVGKQWADEVHAARAAQEALGQKISTQHDSIADAAAPSISSAVGDASTWGSAGNPAASAKSKMTGVQQQEGAAEEDECQSSLTALVTAEEEAESTVVAPVDTSESPGAENCPSPLSRVPTEAVVGAQWAEVVHAARSAQADLANEISSKENSPAGTNEVRKAPIVLEESAQSIGGVLFEAELAMAGFQQDALSCDIAGHPAIPSPKLNGYAPAGSVQTTAEITTPKTVRVEPLERVSTEAVLGTAWTREVRAAEKAEQNLQKDIVLVQQPSETGMQFARELAAAEAAQEALYAELAPLATPETPPGRKKSGDTDGSGVAVHWSPVSRPAGRTCSDAGSAESPFASHGEADALQPLQGASAGQSCEGSIAGTRASSVQDATAAQAELHKDISCNSKLAAVAGEVAARKEPPLWGGFAEYPMGQSTAQEGAALAVRVPVSSKPSVV